MKTTTNPEEITLVALYFLSDGMQWDENGDYAGFDPEDCISKSTSDNVITADNFSYDDETKDFIYEGDDNWYLDMSNIGEGYGNASTIKPGDYVFESGGGYRFQIFRLGEEREFVQTYDNDFGAILGTKKGIIEYLKGYGGDICDEQDLTEEQTKEVLNTCIDYINNMEGVL